MMTRLVLSDNLTKHATKILCLYKTLPSLVATQEYLTCDINLYIYQEIQISKNQVLQILYHVGLPGYS